MRLCFIIIFVFQKKLYKFERFLVYSLSGKGPDRMYLRALSEAASPAKDVRLKKLRKLTHQLKLHEAPSCKYCQ